jgi:hypothetical protein
MIDATPTSEGLHFCCDSSAEAGEPLHASASQVDVWLLLEYDAAWGAKALPESTLSDDVKSYLNQAQKTIGNTRFQFIKQTGRQAGIRFYVAVSHQAKPKLYRFDLAHYEDLLTLNLAEVIEGRRGLMTDERLFLVCTNGKRDVCCSKYGLPLYRALRQIAGDAVWETTHIGGHRFSGTLVCLPHGLYYGRVAPTQAGDVIESYRSNILSLDHYRGGLGYTTAEQAADHFLRRERGLRSIAEVRLMGSEMLAENHWQVRFEMQEGEQALIRVQAEISDILAYDSCKDQEKKPVTVYHCEFV